MMKGYAEKRSRIRISAQMAAKAEIETVSKPSPSTDQPCRSSLDGAGRFRTLAAD